MDQQRRFLTFVLLSFGAMFLWMNFGINYFYPEFAQKQKERAAQQKLAAEKTAQKQDEEVNPVPKAVPDQDNAASDPDRNSSTEETAETEDELPQFPARKITLGSLEADADVYLQVDLNSRGAVLESLYLNDERYRELSDRNIPLRLLGEVAGSAQRSFDLRIGKIDEALQKQGESLETVHWEYLDAESSDLKGVFQYPAPDGSFRVKKTYELHDSGNADRETSPAGYTLDVTLTFENLTGAPQELNYELQGPVGFPLENAENTRRYLSIQAGFVRNGSVRHESISAGTVADQADDSSGIESFRAPVRYLGVDGQYFTTLLLPDEELNQEEANWIEYAQPLLLKKAAEEDQSLISFRLVSNEVEVAANESVSHKYTLFAGPKRNALLQPYDADGTIEYGWFGAISKIMLTIMNFFHDYLYLPYGLAIVLLTMMVRAAMYPISRKHAVAAKRMKELQPKFEEIKKKYENDKEKLARAQMELMKESGFFAGCLPMLLQIPIFIGLYQALYTSVNLRMAEFLWIDNLAAPDNLFTMPFSIPWLGDSFNLLPMITVALFVVQQKLFAPPPANEEQALQQKMMSYMMIFIGVMFYRVPAGLCIYFIASSLWAIAERKVLDFHGTSANSATPAPEKKLGSGKKEVEPEVKPKSSWLQDKINALDSAANPSQSKAEKKPKGKKGRSNKYGR